MLFTQLSPGSRRGPRVWQPTRAGRVRGHRILCADMLCRLGVAIVRGHCTGGLGAAIVRGRGGGGARAPRS